MVWQKECGVDLTRHKDRWTAEQEYLDAKAEAEWEPPTMTQEEVRAEMERLTKMYGER